MLMTRVAAGLLVLPGLAVAFPTTLIDDAFMKLEMRASRDVNPAAVRNTTCTDKNA